MCGRMCVGGYGRDVDGCGKDVYLCDGCVMGVCEDVVVRVM